MSAVADAFREAAQGRLEPSHIGEFLEFVNEGEFVDAAGQPDTGRIVQQVVKLRSYARNAANGGATQAQRQAARRGYVPKATLTAVPPPEPKAGDQGRGQAIARGYLTPDDAA